MLFVKQDMLIKNLEIVEYIFCSMIFFMMKQKLVLETYNSTSVPSSTSSYANHDISSYVEETASSILFLELRHAEYHTAMGLATSKNIQLCNSVTGYMQ